MEPKPPPRTAGAAGGLVLASAVGAGFKDVIGFRGKTSKRGIGCVNRSAPNSGLGGTPVVRAVAPCCRSGRLRVQITSGAD
jgi:hypothetical protein